MIINQGRTYQFFKYSVYALLTVNVGYFFLESLGGVEYTYSDGMKLGDIIVAYSAAIDTAAWLILLLVLELETYLLDDEKLTGPLWWSITALNAACYIVILYSFYGYVRTTEVATGFSFYDGPNPCEFVEAGAAFLVSLEDYVPLTLENCAALTGSVYYNESLNMFGTAESFDLLNRLVWLDVLNAGVWIIIVTILQLEVYLQSSKLFGTKFFKAYKYSKLLLYGILFVDTYYWWRLGAPWDAWDAFLWLVAFFFIEMNVLTWQEEVAHERAEGKIA